VAQPDRRAVFSVPYSLFPTPCLEFFAGSRADPDTVTNRRRSGRAVSLGPRAPTRLAGYRPMLNTTLMVVSTSMGWPLSR
jgi:hypothetical protein